VNLTGVFHCCRAVVPHLLHRPLRSNREHRLDRRKRGQPERLTLQRRQGKVVALTKSLGKELATSNIIVNCITPAVIETDILNSAPGAHRLRVRKSPWAASGRRKRRRPLSRGCVRRIARYHRVRCSICAGETGDVLMRETRPPPGHLCEQTDAVARKGVGVCKNPLNIIIPLSLEQFLPWKLPQPSPVRDSPRPRSPYLGEP